MVGISLLGEKMVAVFIFFRLPAGAELAVSGKFLSSGWQKTAIPGKFLFFGCHKTGRSRGTDPENPGFFRGGGGTDFFRLFFPFLEKNVLDCG